MEIHELNTKGITNPAYVALDDGTDTYKLDLNAKLDAISTEFGLVDDSIADINSDITALQNVDSNTAHIWHGYSTTASGTETKAVSIEFGGTFSPQTGDYLTVVFSQPNTSATMKLSVNSGAAVTVSFASSNDAKLPKGTYIFKITASSGTPISYHFVGVEGVATSTVKGLMSATDKAALDTAVTDIADLKNDISRIETDIYTFTNVPLNTTANNWILNGSGLSTSYANGCLRKYEVKEGQLLYLKLAHDAIGGVYQFQSNASVGATTNPYLIGTPVNDATYGFVVVPTGATWLITSQLKTNTTNVVKLADYETKEKANTAINILDELVGIYNVNLVDTNNFVSGKYVIYTDGTLGNNSDFSASDFIPVEGGKNYKIAVTNAYYGAWYDSTKTYISASVYSNMNTEHSTIYSAPTNAKYFKISCQTAQLSTLSVSANANYNMILEEGAFVNLSNMLNKPLIVSPSDNLVDVFMNNSGRFIYIGAGNYDIIQHYKNKFGNDYFDNYVSYNTTGKIVDAGLPVGRDTVVKFATNAILTCNYSGSNTAVTNNFSAFALYGNVTIDGLNLSCSGIRDAIHDDFDNSYNGHTIIKNCNITSSTRCIAGGMHSASIYVIENNIFNGATSTGYDVTYHNSNNASALNRMTIKDNYFSEGVSLRYYGTSTEKTEVLVCNNSMHKAIDKRAEASATVDNVNVKEWNNTIRS